MCCFQSRLLHIVRSTWWLAGILFAAVSCQPANTATSSTNHAVANADASSSQQPRLRLLVLDDLELARDLEREWTAVEGNALSIRQTTSDEFLGQDQRRLACDVVIFPSRLLGDLAGRDWLESLKESELNEPRWQRRDTWELVRLQEAKWGQNPIAISLGMPVFVLCYREDIFSKQGLVPPSTWAEYRELAEKLSNRSILGDSTPAPEATWYGTCEPMGDHWVSEWLMARAAPYARQRSQFSTLFDYGDLRPLIDGAPFVRALVEMADA